MLKSHINKFSKKAFLIIAVSALFTVSYANTCSKRAFNISINESVSLNELLIQLSDVCKFSIVTKDAIAAKTLSNQLSGISIKDLSIREVFDVLIKGNNLDYEYTNNALNISALQTKTFKIDYITGVREGTAITKASTDSTIRDFTDAGDKAALENNRITVTEKFDFWVNLSEEITAILNNGSENFQAIPPIINQNAGLVTVTATKSQIKRVERYIAEMQRRLKRQVILDVSIIEVQLKNNYTKGIDWSKFNIGFNSYLGGNPSTPSRYTFGNRNETPHIVDPGKLPKYDFIKDKDGNPTDKKELVEFGTPPKYEWWNKMGTKSSQSNGVWAIGANLNFNIEGMINFLETKGKSKVISNPKVMTINNQQALISVGDVINYLLIESTNSSDSGSTVSQDTKQYSTFIGILLNITPEISDDDKIMLRINPSLSSFKYSGDDIKYEKPRGIAPDTKERKISTVVTVNDGDTIILGGLIGQTKGKDNTSVPFLSSIPMVGNLFKSTADTLSTTELVFVITPRLVNDNSNKNLADSLKELGFSKSIYTYE
ncbi:transformation system protein CtsD [Campylobacter blaseri]|uniref:Secretin n=1 Tax=Campylobacter blaseri TaxID=2042961 RepID=A0A2P8R2I5_9BACT|nr:pilus (MSHA type) biogenesis protein MshL [Campylobacter blaseri]PSM52701.1 secretin [Campylobacter blaseri]PSM54349.1 secretin [Campylobacter blaseri]QKF86002.1 transformation system protein CtsD [Campylobacter blaseri]